MHGWLSERVIFDYQVTRITFYFCLKSDVYDIDEFLPVSMVLVRVVIFSLTIIGTVAYLAWQAYRYSTLHPLLHFLFVVTIFDIRTFDFRRRQLYSFKHHPYDGTKTVYFSPDPKGCLSQVSYQTR